MYTYNISWSRTSLFHLFNSLPVILTYLSPNFMSSLHFYNPLNSTTSVAHMPVAEGGHLLCRGLVATFHENWLSVPQQSSVFHSSQTVVGSQEILLMLCSEVLNWLDHVFITTAVVSSFSLTVMSCPEDSISQHSFPSSDSSVFPAPLLIFSEPGILGKKQLVRCLFYA